MKEINLNEKIIIKKSDILQRIYDARRAHQAWVKKAEKLVNGIHGYKGEMVDLNVDKTFIPLSSTSCEFGKWFEHFCIPLSKIDSIGNFTHRIEEHHNTLHETYEAIYFIFFVKPEQKSFLKKLLIFSTNKVSDSDKEKAKIHLDYLKRSSKELLEVLQVLEDKIKVLEPHDLKKLQTI